MTSKVLSIEKIHEILLAHIYQNEKTQESVISMYPDLLPLMEQFKEVAVDQDEQLKTALSDAERYRQEANNNAILAQKNLDKYFELKEENENLIKTNKRLEARRKQERSFVDIEYM